MASSMTRIASRGNSLETASSAEENTTAAADEMYPESDFEEIATDTVLAEPHKKPSKKKSTSIKTLTSEPEISNASPEPEAPATIKDESPLTEKVSKSKKKRKTEKTK